MKYIVLDSYVSFLCYGKVYFGKGIFALENLTIL